MRLYKIFMAMLMVLSVMHSKAADEIYFNELRGASIAPGSIMYVTDEKFKSYSLSQWSTLNNIDVKNFISFELNTDTSLFFYKTPFNATLNVTLHFYADKNDTSLETSSPQTLDLSVHFDTTSGNAYKGATLFKFQGAYKFKIVINSISSPQFGSSPPPIFRLVGKTLIQRQYQFEDTSTDVSVFQFLDQNRLKLSWTPASYPGAEWFDVEWSVVDSFSQIADYIRSSMTGGNITDAIPVDTLNKWFRHNASRITTAASSYTLNLAYNSGFLLYRIRGVQLHYPDSIRYEGEWNYKAAPTMGGTTQKSIVAVVWHQDNLNWQYSAAFAEEGKRKEVIQYFDGSLRNRQSVTLDNSNEVAVVQETIYDAEGRNAAAILPAPINSNLLKYYPAFNVNNSGKPYSFADIINNATTCAIAPLALSNTSGASGYYSSANSFTNLLHKNFIPSAEGFPLSVTEYTPDNTGRIARQGGVGPDFQPGSEHETKYYYGKPTQTELDRLFGSEAGIASHYLKNMVVDPNGQISVSYVNASGKTIATALAGNTPDSLSSLTSNNSTSSVRVNNAIIETGDLKKNALDRTMSADATFTAPVTGIYKFNYNLNPEQLLVQARATFNELVLCNTCKYDLRIEVKDNCNQLLMGVTKSAGVIFSTDYTAPVPINDSFQITINTIGEYHVRYKLEINRDALDYYDSVNLKDNANIRTVGSFLTEELKNMDISNCFTNCQTCDEELGGLNDFLNRFKILYERDSIPFVEADSIYLVNLYTQKRVYCNLIRNTGTCATSPCAEKLDLIKVDVNPGGQYAQFDTTSYTLTGPTDINVLSMYTLVSSFPDENGLPDTITLKDINGEDSIRLAPNELSLKDFIINWKSSWADSLARFHPEYCYYLWCTQNSSFYAFDESVKNSVQTGGKAVQKQYYDRTDPIALLKKDPFFQPANHGGDSTYYKQMRDSLNLYSRSLVGYAQSDKNILAVVDMLVYCKNSSSPWDGCQIDDSCRSVNREWDIYRQLYMNMKEAFYEKARLASPIFSNCKNCYIGSDIIGMIRAADTIVASITDTANEDSTYYIPNLNCVNTCPDDTTYNDFLRPGVSYFISYGSRPIVPTLVPPGYTNGRFYSAFSVATGQDIGCTFFNAWVYIKDDNIVTPVAAPPASACTEDSALVAKYKDKQRRFPDYVSAGSLLQNSMTNNPQLANAQMNIATKLICVSGCEEKADSWINSLQACVNSGNPTADSLKLDSLKQAFILICAAGCEAGAKQPSMTAPESAGLLYHSFETAIQGIIGSTAINTTCAVELLSGVYPYNRQPVEGIATIYESTYEICDKLSSFRSAFATSGYTGTFYQYVEKEIGNGFMLSAQQFSDLEKSCAGCTPIIRTEIPLPVAFTSGRRNVINCTTADSLKTAFLTKFPGIELNTATSDLLFRNFCNQALGFSLGYEDYQYYFDSVCAVQPSSLAKLYDDAPVTTVAEDMNSCIDIAFTNAYQIAQARHKTYIDSVRADFREAYLNRCMAVQTQVRMTADLYEYHYTLYYYDQAGNLVKTIPPAGVQLLSQAQIDSVQTDRRYAKSECYVYTDELNFDGNGAKAFADQPMYKMGINQGMTLEGRVWLKNLNNQGIFSYYDSTLRRGYRFYLQDQKLVFELRQSEFISDSLGYLYGENKVVTTDLTGIMPLNTWVHLAAVMKRKGREMVMHPFITLNGMVLNGTQTADEDYSYYRSSDPPNGTALMIGGEQQNYLYFDGRIKQVRLYRRALDVQEIRQNYTNTCQVPIRRDAMVFWSVMNDGVGEIRNLQNNDSSYTVNDTLSWISNRKGIFPAHGLPTTYVYNSLNQVTKQQTPDAGESKFWYDRLGRLIASQNSEQLSPAGTGNANRYSYTRYDVLGRITEVGEKEGAAAQLDTLNTLNNTQLLDWMNSGSNYQVTSTIYDQINETVVAIPGITQQQQHLRKRVVASIYKDTAATSGYTNATHYSYDINGNVKTLWQEIGALRAHSDNGVKVISYDYDLVSGKVNQVMYQQGRGDQFLYRYRYDAENRLTASLSSRDGLVWNTDAEYRYYLHGPLARTELGTRKVQGIDYAYTLQGWLKGMNTTNLPGKTAVTGDMGGDAIQGSRVSADVAGFALHYYHHDYLGIGASAQSFAGLPGSAGPGAGALFNGNISGISLSLGNMQPLLYRYGYDQLNRLVNKNAYNGLDTSNRWTPLVLNDYKETFSYDANGNILTALRNATTAGGNTLAMDALTYHYQANTNKLSYVTDTVGTGAHTNDIDNQSAGNYSYDKIGNLISDNAENLQSINWTVYGKIKSITKPASAIYYGYDAAGNRVHKKITGTNATEEIYVRDAQGNPLAVYRLQGDSTFWKEQHLYGSSRLGIYQYHGLLPAAPVVTNGTVTTLSDSLLMGNTSYELSNHLGNVLAVITDKKIGVSSIADSSLTDHYVTDILSLQDYYAFGSQMLGRSYQANKYRYGFNGKENDNEVKGDGNQQDYGMRIYDSRLGRFLSIDPLYKEFPELSSYQFASNTPIQAIDLDGEEGMHYADLWLRKKAPVLAGILDGVGNSFRNSWNFISKDAWKGETWKQTGLFMEEAIMGMSTVKVFETPRLDLAVKNFEKTVIYGDAYTRSRYLSEFSTDVLTGYFGSKGLGNVKAFMANTVKTDWVIAKQSLSIGALKAAAETKSGKTLYRIGTTGKSQQGAAAQYWSLENPLADPEGYAKKYNVPIENIQKADFIETATLKKDANFITREAGKAPGSGNTGKGIEIVIEKGGTSNNVITPIKKNK